MGSTTCINSGIQMFAIYNSTLEQLDAGKVAAHLAGPQHEDAECPDIHFEGIDRSSTFAFRGYLSPPITTDKRRGAWIELTAPFVVNIGVAAAEVCNQISYTDVEMCNPVLMQEKGVLKRTPEYTHTLLWL